MPTFFVTLLAAPRRWRKRLPANSVRARTTLASRSRGPAKMTAGAEDGVLLLEVLISAMIVGLIVVGTFTGLDVAQGTGISERDHNEAILLASESQEAMRSAPASTFESPSGTYEHVYTSKLDGENYTVTQKASFLNNSGESTACSATNPTRQEANSLRLSSVITWPQQVASKRAPVSVSSVTTPPTGSALEVDVGNYPTPTAGVSGVSATIKYFADEEGSTESSLSGTTESTGCVVFSAVPATSAKVEMGEKSGYIDPRGGSKWPTQEVTIAPNYTTHDPVTLNEGGAITAELQYKSSPLYKHKRNGNALPEIAETVTGDTVVAYNELMESSPNFEIGSAKAGTFSSGTYTPVFGSTSAETWASTITTPIEAGGTKYPHGNLFPFPSPGAWQVYAGACTANEPEALNSAIKTPTAFVTPGKTQGVEVPITYMKLNVYTGKVGSLGSIQETAYPVTITNTGCTTVTPDNETAINEPKETQYTTTNSTTWPEYGGHLEHPFLPFGSGKLCLAYNSGSGSGSKHYTYTTTYNLTAEGEYTRNVDLGETGSKYKETLTGPSGSESYEFLIHNAGTGTASCS
jgi:Tfp pilus assembly protein PilV